MLVREVKNGDIIQKMTHKFNQVFYKSIEIYILDYSQKLLHSQITRIHEKHPGKKHEQKSFIFCLVVIQNLFFSVKFVR